MESGKVSVVGPEWVGLVMREVGDAEAEAGDVEVNAAVMRWEGRVEPASVVGMTTAEEELHVIQ